MKLKYILVPLIALLVLPPAIIAGGYTYMEHDKAKRLDIAVAAAQQRIADRLRDPGSVQFRNLKLHSYMDFKGGFDRFVEDPLVRIARKFSSTYAYEYAHFDPSNAKLCGEINSKNAFGAYVGFKHFYSEVAQADMRIDEGGEGIINNYAARECEVMGGLDVASVYEPKQNN